MPTVSTDKNDQVNPETNGLVEMARRRIEEGFYDRVEVRRTVAALLLKDLARSSSAHRSPGSSRPETA